MITIEVCWIDGLDEQNLNIAKCILKLRQAQAFPGSEVWIRINPNYIRVLEKANLIQKNAENKSFVQLTHTGHTVQIFSDTLNLSLKEYFVHENDIDLLIEDSLKIAVSKTSYKVMHNICHSCGKVKTHLNHIIDTDKNNGMYCNQCLNGIGYSQSLNNANTRRTEARNAFSIRQN